MMKNKGIYIHIPFCLKKCIYCDFATRRYDSKKIQIYLNSLHKEIQSYAQKQTLVDTVYIGGGTPSLLSEKQLSGLVQVLQSNFTLKPIEWTVEANPEDITPEKIEHYLSVGINRISLGVQSTDDIILKKMWRHNDFEATRRAVSLLKSFDFPNISVDMIYGFPGQNTKSIAQDLDWIKEVLPDHISWYNLIWEESTALYYEFLNNRVNASDEDEEYAMYQLINEVLSELGYEHYEISNFARPGKKSVHNLKYWHNEEYIGCGLSAVGTTGNKRFVNTSVMKEYIQKIDRGELPCREVEKLDESTKKTEYLIMHLRLNQGINRKAYTKLFGEDLVIRHHALIEQACRLGDMICDEDRVAFTEKGFFISNYYLAQMMDISLTQSAN